MVQEEDALFKQRRTGNVLKKIIKWFLPGTMCTGTCTGTLLKEAVLEMQDEIQDTRGWFTTLHYRLQVPGYHNGTCTR